MRTLWDLIRPKHKRRKPAGGAPARAKPPAEPRRTPMRDKYDTITKQMLDEYGVRVRKWRSSMSGVAWEVHYENGKVSKLIESPRPRGPMSAAVFLHEIGHHAIGFGRYSPRCLEEYHAWAFSLEQMERLGLNVTDAVHRRMHESLNYAIWKARRRGLKRLPVELAPYIDPPARAQATRLRSESTSGGSVNGFSEPGVNCDDTLWSGPALGNRR